jgi:outer membrane protein assembly factor BamE (lipoprotein component of BamABCDE complex)
VRKIIYTAGVIMLSLLLLTGCASSGNKSLRKESEASVAQKIFEGKTTKDEVRSLFGSPISTTFTEGGLEIWRYQMAKISADAVNFIPFVNMLGTSATGTKKELTVLFDDKGIVKRYSMSESPVQVKTGLFQ